MSTTLLEDAELSPETQIEPPAWAVTRAGDGAAWLDSKFGPDWDRRINLETLDIGTLDRCILGQLGCQTSTRGLMFPGQAIKRGLSLGFLDILTLLLPIGPVKRAYQPLSNAWRAVVRERWNKKPAQTQPAGGNSSQRRGWSQAA
jgi:hypothetical protein